MSPKRLVLTVTAVSAAVALAGCGGGDSEGSDGGTTGAAAAGAVVDKIDIKDFAYGPKNATAKVGQEITWTNQDSAKHDVDFTDKSFESELVGKGETITFTPSKAGTFDYFCSVHQYMKATLTVQ